MKAALSLCVHPLLSMPQTAAHNSMFWPFSTFEALPRTTTLSKHIKSVFLKLFLNDSLPNKLPMELKIKFNVKRGPFVFNRVLKGIINHIGRVTYLLF